ncbi:MAG: AAA family ATPase [Candidatus Sungbacteria bacterium]|nr:AAA family ATPase [Candidatus Sungbacteria bacterium]
MKLIQFHLSGFKSFAKQTTLEFPQPVTAIVGPNGSGKSNLAEAIRWVLGEQSMKILRGKRGEDLIFNGTPDTPRMGKAGVRLVFDNRDGKIPIDFEQVIFERKIFRDGTNEYYLNNSQVRLKDVVELLARMGLGETKHNIIGQGEVDRTLLAGARERREMLEEAIGLRVYQLKKAEAERRLEETSKNIIQAQALLKEISPHLRFLRLQAEKAENRTGLEQELRKTTIAWILSSKSAIERELAKTAGAHQNQELRLTTLSEEISAIKKDIAEAEEKLKQYKILQQGEKEISVWEQKRWELERELGRVEGKIEAGGAAKASVTHAERTIEISYVRKHLSTILDRLEEIQVIDDLDDVRERIEFLVSSIETVLGEIEEQARGESKAEVKIEAGAQLKQLHEKIQKELEGLHKKINDMRESLRDQTRAFTEIQEALRGYERAIREREEERGSIQSAIQRWLFEKERIAEREQEVIEEEGRQALSPGEFNAIVETPLASHSPDELTKKIEKLRIRLEEVGGIDPSVVKEYRDTKTRHEFLEKEIGDLERALRDLRLLIKELDETIERDFKNGFNKIKEEFNNYFRIIFGGGKGVLRYAELRNQNAESEDSDGNTEPEYGIEIEVDVPRKRVHSIAMLSGGERALTSIALLFAITAVNPPPFLVLDETDAALDEANSQKYAAILKELAKKTQLILITHNRETMKAAGVLYGVTMGSDGVSKLLSLKLDEAEAYTNR